MTTRRLNVTLDGERAAKLARIADRAHVSDGTLARSLLSSAIDDADPDAATITQILEGIPGFAERLTESEKQIETGDFIDLEEL
ncbi:MAG: hypothetical protein WD830_01735 [Chloroflexota bacterium]